MHNKHQEKAIKEKYHGGTIEEHEDKHKGTHGTYRMTENAEEKSEHTGMHLGKAIHEEEEGHMDKEGSLAHHHRMAAHHHELAAHHHESGRHEKGHHHAHMAHHHHHKALDMADGE